VSLRHHADADLVGVASSVDRARTVVAEEPVDCVVSGDSLDDGDVAALLDAVRAERPTLPVVVYGDPDPTARRRLDDARLTAVHETTDAPGAALAARVETLVDCRDDVAASDDPDPSIARRVLNTLADPVVAFDADGRVGVANEAAERACDRDQAALVGTAAAALFDADGVARYRDAVADVRDGARRRARVDVGVGDAEYELHVAPRDRDGHGGVVTVWRDVTDDRARCRDLERQNERLDEFASVVSHDLQNPLSVAQGRLHLAREDGDLSHLDPVADALDRIDTIVTEVLAMARRGQTVDELEPTPVADLAWQAWDCIDAPESTLELVDPPTVVCDPARTGELLQNLLCNAVDHADGPVAVEVGVLAAADGTTEGFYVADDGPGIPADDRDGVFEAGYTTAADGTGLGLSIVRTVADGHGWTVSVAESESDGARFELRDVDVA
jgi:signal transduction histidine kinase